MSTSGETRQGRKSSPGDDNAGLAALETRREAPASLDTEAVTQRVTLRSTHNSAGSRKDAGSATGRPHGNARFAVSREEWNGQLAELTALHREQRARAFEVRGRALALQRRREHRLGGAVARDHRGRVQGSVPGHSQWHTSRAKGKRYMFQNIATCGQGSTLELVCRNSSCGERFTLPLGCGAAFFCPACRKRRAAAFRVDFQRKQLGLVAAANRAGLTHRFRRRAAGGRFAERLVTLTVPHTDERGTPLDVGERIDVLVATWERFWRLFRDELRGKLRGFQSGITIHNSREGLPMPRGKAPPRDELSLFELVSSLRVLEWTPGGDGQGHPHMHVWLFSPFIERARIASLWSRAHSEVTAPSEVSRLLVVDVRAAHECEGGIANELVKYLTKDWQVTSDGVARVSPEVFAQVYAKLDGKRLRQSSAGLAHWAVAKDKSCPCCAFSSEREHWARVFIANEDQQRSQTPSRGPPDLPDVPNTPLSRGEQLREEYEAKRAAQRRRDGALLYARPGMGFLRPVTPEVPTSRVTEAETHMDAQLKLRGF